MSSNLSTMRPPNLMIIPLTSLISFQAFLFKLQTKQDLLFTLLHITPHCINLTSLLLFSCPGECCDTSRGCVRRVAAARLLPRTRSCKLPPTLRSPEPEPVPALRVTTQSNFCFLSIPYFFTNVTCQEEGSRKKNANDLSQILANTRMNVEHNWEGAEETKSWIIVTDTQSPPAVTRIIPVCHEHRRHQTPAAGFCHVMTLDFMSNLITRAIAEYQTRHSR